MKTIFGLLLVVSIYGTTNSLQLGWSSDNSASRAKRFSKSEVDSFNSIRKSFEAESNIVMPNLTGDDALEKIAKELPDDCNKWKHGSNYRIEPDMGDDTSERLYGASLWLETLSPGYQDFPIPDAQKEVLKKLNAYMDASAEHWIMYGLEHLNEQQTKVACADTKCTGTLTPEVQKALNVTTADYKMKAVCVYGPTNKWNPQIRKALYANLKSRGPRAGNETMLVSTIALAEALLPSLPGGTPSESKNIPEQSAPAQGVPAPQQAPAPSSPASPASTLATGWLSVVVLVLGSVF